MTFQPGHPRYGGRKKGVSYTQGPSLYRAVTEAAARVGYDGKGREQLVGWLKKQCELHPVEYLALIAKVFPAVLVMDNRESKSKTLDDCEYETVEQVQRTIEDNGLRLTYDRTNGNGGTPH